MEIELTKWQTKFDYSVEEIKINFLSINKWGLMGPLSQSNMPVILNRS